MLGMTLLEEYIDLVFKYNKMLAACNALQLHSIISTNVTMPYAACATLLLVFHEYQNIRYSRVFRMFFGFTQIPTSVSVSVVHNILYHFGITAHD